MVALIFLAFPAFAGELEEGGVIRVMAGEQFDFQTPQAVRRVAVGDPTTADVSVLSRHEILILGKKPGATSLLLWVKNSGQPKTYRILVEKPLPAQAPGSDMAGHLAAEGEQVIVQGEMKDVLQHQTALRMAENLVAGDATARILDRSVISLSGQVQVDVKIVELSKKVLKETGINLLGNDVKYRGDSMTVGVFSPSSLRTANLTATGISTDASLPVAEAFHLVLGSTKYGVLGVLGLLERNGLARTLAQPSMTVVSGQTATFMAGGEFPIPIAQGLGQVTVQYKPYGIRLTLTPTVFSKDRIAIKLAPEVSELDFSNAVTSSGVSVPGVLTRRAETTVELGDGESFVIAGLISRNFIDSVDKVPGLGDIPVLGAFFKSTRFAREDKELVIIATPTLVRPLAAKADLPPLPGAEYNQHNPSWMKQLFYGGFAKDDESVGLSR